MILIVSKEERELVKRLRDLQPIGELGDLSTQILSLKKQIVQLEIERDKKTEDHAREDRELRHMIGLEKKRQEVEITQAKKDTELIVREANLAADKKRFEEQLQFNTRRFETMEKYLKEMMADILTRLPNVNLTIDKRVR